MPFNIIIVDFDAPLVQVLETWLGATNVNHKIRQMFKACDIKMFLMFRMMEEDNVAALERNIAQAPTKLREVHSIRINKKLMFI